MNWNDAPGSFVIVDGKRTELNPDTVVALSPRTAYSTRGMARSKHFYIHFVEEEPYSTLKPGVFVFREVRLLSLAKEMATELSAPAEPVPSRRILLKAGIYASEALLAIPASRLPAVKLFDKRVEKALETMDANPGVSLEELAEALSMSKNSFINLFRSETGSSPQKLAMKRRLEKACVLLHFSEKNIKQIAYETGFCDRYHFSRTFSAEYSCGPADFRKRMKI